MKKYAIEENPFVETFNATGEKNHQKQTIISIKTLKMDHPSYLFTITGLGAKNVPLDWATLHKDFKNRF